MKRIVASCGLRVVCMAAAVIMMVVGLIHQTPTARAEGYIWTEQLYSYESAWDGYTGGYAAFFAGTDTAQFILWWGKQGLSPWADDVEFAVTADTTGIAGVDTLVVSLVAYPIVYDPDEARILGHRQANGEVLWEKGISLTETTTGRSSSLFTFNPDSTYIFHSATWWSGMEMLGVLVRAFNQADQADSLYFHDVWGQYRRRD